MQPNASRPSTVGETLYPIRTTGRGNVYMAGNVTGKSLQAFIVKPTANHKAAI